MNPTDIANALLFGIPFVTYAGLQHGWESLKAYTMPSESGDLTSMSMKRGQDRSASPDKPSLCIAVATSSRQMAAAHALVRQRYAWRGYGFNDAGNSDAPVQPNASRDITFVVESADALVGTVTLGLDGPGGLLAERTHAHAVAQARANGSRVCEVTRLALAAGADSQTVLGLLWGLAHLVGHKVHEVTDVFIEVNPRHVAFYSKVFGFVVAAGERVCERVRAPSVLLRAEADILEESLVRMTTARTMRPLSAYATQ